MYNNLVDKVLSKYWRNRFSQIFQERNFDNKDLRTSTHFFIYKERSSICKNHSIKRGGNTIIYFQAWDGQVKVARRSPNGCKTLYYKN